MLGSTSDSKIWNEEGKKVPIVKTRYACPQCGAQVNAEHRKLVCSANSSHSWNDTAAFLGLNPQVKYEESKPPVKLSLETGETQRSLD